MLALSKDKVKSNNAIKLLPKYLDRHEIYRFLKQSDCLYPCIDQKVLVWLLQAMLLGKPVIATNSLVTRTLPILKILLVDYELVELKELWSL